MVRLLQANHGTIGKISIKFQSHNGAIAAVGSFFFWFVVVVFQSHNGAIAAIPAFLNTVTLFLFQSHNGAIAAAPLGHVVARVVLFQSHNGAIAACQIIQYLREDAASFNPTMVRLLLAMLAFVNPTYSKVSIPQWCDCCIGKALASSL